jgi:hypothetical protein
MARETTDEHTRKALNDLAAENLAKAEELERQEALLKQPPSSKSK